MRKKNSLKFSDLWHPKENKTKYMDFSIKQTAVTTENNQSINRHTYSHRGQQK